MVCQHDTNRVTGLITRHLDLWSSAQQKKSASGRGSGKKIDLYGIKKLRELILELAVRGKLVPQNPADEPAAVLLQRIAEEKARLVAEKKIKKQKPLPPITDEEKPFELPEGWSWAQFGNALFNKDSERIPLSVDERRSRQGNYNYYGASGIIDKIDDYLFDKPLLLIGEDGANLINRTTPIAFIAKGKYWVNNHAHVLDGISLAFLEYICLYINSINLEAYITGTAQPKMNQAKMNSILIAIPPAAEQHRIVAKVDELMALCDQLEQQSEASISAHALLVETLLTTLTNSTDAAELEQNWQRIAAHFDTLFTTEHSIDQLKQTVLQLAVMGRIHVGATKPIRCVLRDCLSFGPRNGYSPKESPSVTNTKVLKLGATSYGMLDLEESKYIDENPECDSHLWLRKGDILIQRGNSASFVGSNVHIAQDVTGYIYPDLMMKLRCDDSILPEYLSMWLSAPQSRQFMWERMTGTSGTMPKISKKIVESIPIAIPKIEDQIKIITKVDQIMSICDQLKDRIQAAQQTQLHLADALVDQAVS